MIRPTRSPRTCRRFPVRRGRRRRNAVVLVAVPIGQRWRAWSVAPPVADVSAKGHRDRHLVLLGKLEKWLNGIYVLFTFIILIHFDEFRSFDELRL